ncbi:hypothetical protein Clacol_006793 [Clathrus columnatus]|uniref:CTLH domain-containing protein n=1 Tax=Clathrus columnatus TaxID=1419009 RepID=A0AAV5AKU6_9AGAM|nr:hypothetical protein Clacol_006793 [Clathrus columnatus]
MNINIAKEDDGAGSRRQTPSPNIDSVTSIIIAGPSSILPISNGHTNGATMSNGHAPAPSPRRFKEVAKVSPSGSTLYKGSNVNREEFIRLVMQSLRDIGYVESANVLEAESGYRLESNLVATFRESVLDGRWDEAILALDRLEIINEEYRRSAKFLIRQQKYLELLEAQDVNNALLVLRTELAPLNIDPERLHLLMSASSEEVRRWARWDGAKGSSRQQLLYNLQRYIPSTTMIPSRRFDTLLEQARQFQRNSCLYHNTSEPFSLYTDHTCGRERFPTVTTLILEHANEVWDLRWSNNGEYLATASADKTAIIWRIGANRQSTGRECVPEHVLTGDSEPVNSLAWSPDDETLLTCSDQVIKMWKVKTGVCFKDLRGHTEIVTAVEWLHDGSGFISAGMDSRIIFWDNQGKQRDAWENVPIRVTDIAAAPNGSRFIAVGISRDPISVDIAPDHLELSSKPPLLTPEIQRFEKRVMIWSWEEKCLEDSFALEDFGEVTSVKISQDSRYALIGHGPDEIQLWDLFDAPRLARKYIGHRQGKNVIRSCFGGVDEHFIASGSENGKVYIWQRETGQLLEVLPGHGPGSVNCVAWNPKDPCMFASCSDDHTIRIWETVSEHELTGEVPAKGKRRWITDADVVQ